MTLNALDLPTRAEEMFCHAVYTAWHGINRAYAPHLAQLGLTYPQYITLTLLWERDGQSIGALGAQLNMESSTLTPLVKRLEVQGHVRRNRGTKDERQVFVHLTESGRALHADAPKITACMVTATGLRPDSLRGLVATLGQLTENLRP